MPVIRLGDLATETATGESTLDALLRAGAPVLHACRAGSCGSCMLRAVEGEPSTASQASLKDAWRAQGYFLACICYPSTDLTVSAVGSDARIAGRIAALDSLSGDVLRVRIVTDARFDYRPGQYLALVREDGLARSYSIASTGVDPWLELHVRCLPHGRMSGWLRDEARVGAAVQLLGPSGACFYVPGRPEQPLLLVGTGTGLAPLYGVLRDALAQGHRGPIHLVHGALRAAGLYLQDELRQIADDHPTVHYLPSLYDHDGPVDKVIAKLFPSLTGWRAFVCGDSSLVALLRKRLFLDGLPLREIHADAFVPAAE